MSSKDRKFMDSIQSKTNQTTISHDEINQAAGNPMTLQSNLRPDMEDEDVIQQAVDMDGGELNQRE